MKETTIKLLNFVRKLKYCFSREKKILDGYTLSIRRLEPMSDLDWKKFKELAKNERSIFDH